MDLSRGGVRFLTSREYAAKTRVELDVFVPDESEPLQLTGRVAWSWLYPGHAYQVAVEFEPYGHWANANSPEVLARIEALEARYVKSSDRMIGWPLEQVGYVPMTDPAFLSEAPRRLHDDPQAASRRSAVT